MNTARKEPQGCSSAIFPFLRRKTQKVTETALTPSSYQAAEESAPIVQANVSETLPYRVRDDFLSPAEFSLYKILCALGDTGLVIQSKVRLADIFFVVHPNENMTYFNRIAQKHLDFLVCDSVTMKPLLGIELDDFSHKRSDRQERDDFVDQVFEAASLPLLRLPVQREYNTKEVAAKIAPLLKDKFGALNTSPQPEINNQDNAIPLCPKCGIPMILRTVSQGEHKGKRFFGCKNYPRCREMKSFTA